jgi:hypothetical protein
MLKITLPTAACAFCLLAWADAASAQVPSVQTIIQKSVAVNHADFEAATEFDWIEVDRTGKGSKKFRVTMIEGTPYYRLIGVNGKPLSPDQDAQEQKKLQQVIAHRRAETPAERHQRIEKFQRERRRDNSMMEELTKAFNFTFMGLHKIHGYGVYVLKATPRPGYKPPNMDTQVLTGMHGELWIDEKAFHWVKVTAQVIHPVSIEGFLAQVQPGTRFELDNAPVGDGSIWQASHFSMRSNAKVLYMFERQSQEDDTYTDYQPINASGQNGNDSVGGKSMPSTHP